APAACADGAPRPAGLRRRQVRRPAHLRQGHRPARPRPDVPAPGPLRADHPHRRGAAVVARPLRLPARPGADDVNTELTLTAMRDVIQRDVGNRGLARDPHDNLLTACPDDFAAACRSIAETPGANLGVVTGFYIPAAEPPASETDGPLGAAFLARALAPLGIRVSILADGTAPRAVRAALNHCKLSEATRVGELPLGGDYGDALYARSKIDERFTHLIALERVGLGHQL